MFAIFKREIRSYFQTVVGWLFIAAVLALYGLYFYAYNLRSGSPYVSYSLSAVSFIVMIAVPVLTMRSFAEERHTKTDQLMLTSPVPLGKIVFGKYLAMVGVFSIAMIVVALTPLFLSIYGSVPLGESYVAVLGFWLYGCACIADRYADVSGNGKSGYRSSAWICSTVSWLHDVEYYQHDLTER